MLLQNNTLLTHVNNSKWKFNSHHPPSVSLLFNSSTRKPWLLTLSASASKASASCGTNALVTYVMSAHATLVELSRGCRCFPRHPCLTPVLPALMQSRQKPANNNQHQVVSLLLCDPIFTTLRKLCTHAKGHPLTSHSLARVHLTCTGAKTVKGPMRKRHGSLFLITSPA